MDFGITRFRAHGERWIGRRALLLAGVKLGDRRVGAKADLAIERQRPVEGHRPGALVRGLDRLALVAARDRVPLAQEPLGDRAERLEELQPRRVAAVLERP